MIDTHAHLDDKQFDSDRDEVIQRAFKNGVEKIINVGAGLGSSQRSVELAENPLRQLADGGENIFAAIGLHPHYFNEYKNKSFDKIEELKKLLKREKVIAIGEIGLDYFSHDGKIISAQEKELQKKGFVFQLDLARELNLPVIVHCRASKENPDDAYKDLFEIILSASAVADQIQNTNLVFHCYGGNLEFTKKLLQHENIHFSFTGNITYAKTGVEILEAIKIIPMGRIMLETDCPYLAPVPMRGKRNEPAYVSYVAEKIAEIKQISVENVLEITTKNAEKFFRI